MKPITITDVRALPGDSAFLIDDGKTAILYDSGFAFTGREIAENIKKILKTYLECSEAVTVDTARRILAMLKQGCSQQEILAYFREKDHRDNVAPTYPLDAFLLNTDIMIRRVREELMKEN